MTYDNSTDIGLGGGADSYYEYLLKLWLEGGKKEAALKDQWRKVP